MFSPNYIAHYTYEVAALHIQKQCKDDMHSESAGDVKVASTHWFCGLASFSKGQLELDFSCCPRSTPLCFDAEDAASEDGTINCVVFKDFECSHYAKR